MEDSKRWKPEWGEEYWFVDTNCAYDRYTWDNDAVDNGVFDAGNCFQTEEEAKAAAEKVKELLLNLQPACNKLATYLQDEPLTKLTTDVFARADCPEWAKYAAVDVQGLAYWYQYSPIVDERIGCWDNLKNKRQLIDGFFDRSDWQNSLVERPTKLPDWCRVGEWVYSTVHNEYVKIKDIDEFKVEFYRGTYYTVSHKALREDYKPARLRPYNADEMKALVGKSITLSDGAVCLCTAWSAQNNVIVFDNTHWKSKDLIKYGYTIDAEPCGVLEYLNNYGEWVK